MNKRLSQIAAGGYYVQASDRIVTVRVLDDGSFVDVLTEISLVGGGNVFGPASSNQGNFAAFADASGKQLADTGYGPDDFVAAREAITPATATKITYTAAGLVASGTQASTDDIAESANRRYVTDAQLAVIAVTSGVNTGDQTNITGNAGTVTTINGKISAGSNISITGAGTTGSPYVINGAASNPGTVTSVSLALPAIFSISGSPVTSSGTLTGAFTTQAANIVFAGPASGAAASPTFRALVALDIPSLASVYVPYTGATADVALGARSIAAALFTGQYSNANHSAYINPNGSAVFGTSFVIDVSGNLNMGGKTLSNAVITGYLPLTAGSGNPLSGDLYMNSGTSIINAQNGYNIATFNDGIGIGGGFSYANGAVVYDDSASILTFNVFGRVDTILNGITLTFVSLYDSYPEITTPGGIIYFGDEGLGMTLRFPVSGGAGNESIIISPDSTGLTLGCSNLSLPILLIDGTSGETAVLYNDSSVFAIDCGGNSMNIVAGVGLTISGSTIVSGDLSCTRYLLTGDHYAFQNASFPNAGLFFSQTSTRYEFRDLSAVANAHISIAGAITGTQLINPLLQGGTAANDDITIRGTSNATKTTSYVLLQDNGGNVGVGNTVPTARMHLAAGSATANTAPLKLTSGTNLTTGETGAVEYNGTNLFFTRSGTTRESVLTGNSGAAAPSTTATPVFSSYYGGNTKAMGDPNSWASVVIGGTTYKIPLYT